MDPARLVRVCCVSIHHAKCYCSTWNNLHNVQLLCLTCGKKSDTLTGVNTNTVGMAPGTAPEVGTEEWLAGVRAEARRRVLTAIGDERLGVSLHVFALAHPIWHLGGCGLGLGLGRFAYDGMRGRVLGTLRKVWVARMSDFEAWRNGGVL